MQENINCFFKERYFYTFFVVNAYSIAAVWCWCIQSAEAEPDRYRNLIFDKFYTSNQCAKECLLSNWYWNFQVAILRKFNLDPYLTPYYLESFTTIMNLSLCQKADVLFEASEIAQGRWRKFSGKYTFNPSHPPPPTLTAVYHYLCHLGFIFFWTPGILCYIPASCFQKMEWNGPRLLCIFHIQ